jgi:hypothetical protein
MGSVGRDGRVLRAVLLWGTTVLAVRELRPGQSLQIGDGARCAGVRPLGSEIPDNPLVALPSGGTLDTRGATAGWVELGGAQRPLTERAGKLVLRSEDCGLVQYGPLSLYFEFSRAAPKLPRAFRWDASVFAAGLFALVLVGGALLLARELAPLTAGRAPHALLSREELTRLYGVHLADPESAPALDVSARRSAAAPAPNPPDSSLERPVNLAEALRGRDARLETAVLRVRSAAGGEQALKRAGLGVITPTPSAADLTPPTLGSELINEVMLARYPRFRACYDRARVTLPGLEGSLAVHFVVGADGRVSTAGVLRSTLASPDVERCVVDELLALSFPPAQSPSPTSFSFVFSPPAPP